LPDTEFKWFHGQGNWYSHNESSILQLREHMSRIHELKQLNKLRLNEEGLETANQFSWSNTAKTIMESL